MRSISQGWQSYGSHRSRKRPPRRARARGFGMVVLASLAFAACGSRPSGMSAADSWVEKGRCDEAITEYGEALSENPELVDAYLGLGRCYQRMEKLDEAATAFGEALARETSERTLVPLAKVRTSQGLYDRADALLVQLVAIADGRDDRVRYQRQLAE
ncbi:MAG: tetratricopeptide repeat protein, partial [Myxococcota bacterium]